MNINEIVRRAKREIQSGYWDRKLKNPNRDKVILLDRGSAGRFYGFSGGFHCSAGQQRKDHMEPGKDRHYLPEDFGLKEKS